jgi:putative drug exporter of the RND superfamily
VSLLVSGVPFFMEIGFAVTLGILLVAFVVSLLPVQATTGLLGRCLVAGHPPAQQGRFAVEPAEAARQEDPAREVKSHRS